METDHKLLVLHNCSQQSKFYKIIKQFTEKKMLFLTREFFFRQNLYFLK